MAMFDDWCNQEEERDRKKRLWKLTEKDRGRNAIRSDLALSPPAQCGDRCARGL
jgi:hypothetical protein